jgi:hypothetical protein
VTRALVSGVVMHAVLEPLVSRLEFSEFLFVLPWWFLGRTQKVFGEMYVRL